MREIQRLWRQLPELGFEDARLFLAHLARDPQFMATQVDPYLQNTEQSADPFIAATYGTRESSNCLQVFVWAPGAATPIHDHTSWGAYLCVAGKLLEERYTRLDEGIQPTRARLRKQWYREWSRDDGASLVRAYEGGIHRVSNPSRRAAVSVHIYGPRQGMFDGRDYNPWRDTVCDRLEPDAAPTLAMHL